MNPSARVLALILRAPTPQDDPRLTLAYHRRARAVVAQWERAVEMKAQGLDIGVYGECVE